MPPKRAITVIIERGLVHNNGSVDRDRLAGKSLPQLLARHDALYFKSRHKIHRLDPTIAKAGNSKKPRVCKLALGEPLVRAFTRRRVRYFSVAVPTRCRCAEYP